MLKIKTWRGKNGQEYTIRQQGRMFICTCPSCSEWNKDCWEVQYLKGLQLFEDIIKTKYPKQIALDGNEYSQLDLARLSVRAARFMQLFNDGKLELVGIDWRLKKCLT